MKKKELASIIEDRVRARQGESVPDSLVFARIRSLGDEIGEPILKGDLDLPSNYLVVALRCPSGNIIKVSMPPAAADKIMSRG